MDIHHFALSRVEFISAFYEKALAPFLETLSLMEEEKYPYEPVYSESGEPQFLSEWSDANQSIDVLGIQCISLLCSTLKLFLEESLRNVFTSNSGRSVKNIKTESEYKSAFKKGWLNGYCQLYEQEFDLNWSESGVNIDLVEELVLVRNRGQHPECITTLCDNFSKSDIEKILSPFFADPLYDNESFYDFIPPTINPKPEKMKAAFEERIQLINWLYNSLYLWGQRMAGNR